MDETRVELTKPEGRVLSAATILCTVGVLALRVLGNVRGVWWPSFALIGGFVAFVICFSIYLARTRRRSLRSVVAPGVPRWLRRVSRGRRGRSPGES